MIDADVLTQILQAFQQVFTLGISRLIPDARWILLSLTIIEVALLGLWIATGHETQAGVSMLVLAMKTTMYLVLITQWGPLTQHLVKGFVALGLKGSGDIISETDFTDPSKVAWFGVSAMTLVYNRVFAYTGWDAVYNLPDILWTGLAATLCLLAFIVFGFQVFVALLEFYGASAVAVVLVPWGMLRYTAFVAEKTLGAMWSHAIRLLLISFIAGAALPILQKQSPGLNPTFAQCVTLALTGWALVLAAWRVPKMAQGLLHGAPSLTTTEVTQGLHTTARTMQHVVAALRALNPVQRGRGNNQRRRS